MFEFVLKHCFSIYHLARVTDLAIFACSFGLSMPNSIYHELERCGGQEYSEHVIILSTFPMYYLYRTYKNLHKTYKKLYVTYIKPI